MEALAGVQVSIADVHDGPLRDCGQGASKFRLSAGPRWRTAVGAQVDPLWGRCQGRRRPVREGQASAGGRRAATRLGCAGGRRAGWTSGRRPARCRPPSAAARISPGPRRGGLRPGVPGLSVDNLDGGALDPSNRLVAVARSSGRGVQRGPLEEAGGWPPAVRPRVCSPSSARSPSTPGTPAPRAISDPGTVEDLMTDVGLRVAQVTRWPCPILVREPGLGLARPRRGGPVAKGDRRARAGRGCALRRDHKPGGSQRQDSVIRYVIAVKQPT